jgi:hypothetical protein
MFHIPAQHATRHQPAQFEPRQPVQLPPTFVPPTGNEWTDYGPVWGS